MEVPNEVTDVTPDLSGDNFAAPLTDPRLRRESHPEYVHGRRQRAAQGGALASTGWG